MTATYDAKTISNALQNRILQDSRFDENDAKQTICLIKNIEDHLVQAPGTSVDLDAATYINLVSALYNCANYDDTLKPSAKRAVLYAIGELQKCIWHK